MNTINKWTIGLIIISLGMASCRKDEAEPVAKPSISGFEVGLQNSMTAYLGADLHLEAEVVAEGKISTIQLEIHSGEEVRQIALEWEFDSLYTKFSGLKNTTFHEHVDIPLTVDTGHYHVHFIVTDQTGQQTLVESDLHIEFPSDVQAPTITIGSAPTNGQAFTNGQAIRIAGTVGDETALGGLLVALVRADQLLTDAQVSSNNSIVLVHTHEFPDSKNYSFDISIHVGTAQDFNNPSQTITWQSGEYYLLVKTKDAFGGNWTYSAHYPIQVTI